MGIALWTVLERFVPVANVLEEVDLVFPSEQRGTDAMNRCISPSLRKESWFSRFHAIRYAVSTHLVVEPALLVEEVKEFHVSLPSPEVQIANFEITPDCINAPIRCTKKVEDKKIDIQWQRL